MRDKEIKTKREIDGTLSFVYGTVRTNGHVQIILNNSKLI